jgi:triacylglycerol lipase
MHGWCRALVAGIAILGACDSASPPSAPVDGSVVPSDTGTAPALLHPAVPPLAQYPAGWGPPYPIVLVHGFFGLYFWDVLPALTSAGFAAYEVRIDPFNDSEARGEQLARLVADILRSTGAAKVNLVGHSQAALCTRYVAFKMPTRIGAVVSLGGANRGTEVADLFDTAPELAVKLLDPLFDALSLAYGDVTDNSNIKAAMSALNTKGAEAFNAAYPDRPEVAYYSIAGRSDLQKNEGACAVPAPPPFIVKWNAYTDPVNPVWLGTAKYLEGTGQTPHLTDGLVRVDSQIWGQFLGCIPADHTDQIGQFFGQKPGPGNPFDHLTFYEDLALFLQQQGF